MAKGMLEYVLKALLLIASVSLRSFHGIFTAVGV